MAGEEIRKTNLKYLKNVNLMSFVTHVLKYLNCLLYL